MPPKKTQQTCSGLMSLRVLSRENCFLFCFCLFVCLFLISKEGREELPHTPKGLLIVKVSWRVTFGIQETEICSTFKMECFEISEHLRKYPQLSASVNYHEEIIWFPTFSIFIGITPYPLRRLPTVYHQVSHSVLEFISIKGIQWTCSDLRQKVHVSLTIY